MTKKQARHRKKLENDMSEIGNEGSFTEIVNNSRMGIDQNLHKDFENEEVFEKLLQGNLSDEAGDFDSIRKDDSAIKIIESDISSIKDRLANKITYQPVCQQLDEKYKKNKHQQFAEDKYPQIAEMGDFNKNENRDTMMKPPETLKPVGSSHMFIYNQDNEVCELDDDEDDAPHHESIPSHNEQPL